jgi:hypothetical protein
MPIARSKAGAGVDAAEFMTTFSIDELLGRLCQVIGQIRSLAGREPSHLYQHCQVGTGLVRELAERLCKHAIETPTSDDETRSRLLDAILSTDFFDSNRLSQYSRQALKALRQEVLETWAPRCCAKLEEELGKR